MIIPFLLAAIFWPPFLAPLILFLCSGGRQEDDATEAEPNDTDFYGTGYQPEEEGGGGELPYATFKEDGQTALENTQQNTQNRTRTNKNATSYATTTAWGNQDLRLGTEYGPGPATLKQGRGGGRTTAKTTRRGTNTEMMTMTRGEGTTIIPQSLYLPEGPRGNKTTVAAPAPSTRRGGATTAHPTTTQHPTTAKTVKKTAPPPMSASHSKFAAVQPNEPAKPPAPKPGEGGQMLRPLKPDKEVVKGKGNEAYQTLYDVEPMPEQY